MTSRKNIGPSVLVELPLEDPRLVVRRHEILSVEDGPVAWR